MKTLLRKYLKTASFGETTEQSSISFGMKEFLKSHYKNLTSFCSATAYYSYSLILEPCDNVADGWHQIRHCDFFEMTRLKKHKKT